MRTKQQQIGDELEQVALQIAKAEFPEAALTKGSGCVDKDGDVAGVGPLFLECKNSRTPGKGRSISKGHWISIKSKARRLILTPVHLGFDDDGEVVALIPFKDLVAFVKGADTSAGWTPIQRQR